MSRALKVLCVDATAIGDVRTRLLESFVYQHAARTAVAAVASRVPRPLLALPAALAQVSAAQAPRTADAPAAGAGIGAGAGSGAAGDGDTGGTPTGAHGTPGTKASDGVVRVAAPVVGVQGRRWATLRRHVRQEGKARRLGALASMRAVGGTATQVFTRMLGIVTSSVKPGAKAQSRVAPM